MDVTLLYVDGCPHWQTADARLRVLADEFGLHVTYRKVSSPEEAEVLAFHGSPTVLLDGQDPFPAEGEPGLACRIYQTPAGPAGAPTIELLRAVLATDREGRL